MRLPRWFEDRFPKGGLARAVAVLASGAGASQAIVLLATPLLTRLYSPEEFGVLAVFGSCLGILGVVAGLRYEMAIPLPRGRTAAVQVAGLALASVITVSVLVAVVCLLTGPELLAWLRLELLLPYMWFLPLGVLLSGAYEVMTYWAVRGAAYDSISTSRLQQSVTTVAVQASGGPLGLGPLGLIGGQLAGHLMGLLGLTLRSARRNPIAWSGLHRRGLTWAARRYRRFALYDTWAALLNAAGAQIPAVLFAALSGSQLAGFYLLAVRLLSAPIVLVGKAISQVLLPVTVRHRSTTALPEVVLRAQRVLSVAAFPPFLVFACVAPSIFGWLFGDAWAQAGTIAAWTSVWVALQFVYSPLSVVLLGIEAHRTNLLLQSVSFASRTLAITLGFAWGDAITAIVAYTVVSAVFYAVAILVVASKSGAGVSSSLRELARQLFVAFAIALPTVLALSGPPWLIATGMSCSLALAAVRAVRLLPASTRDAPA